MRSRFIISLCAFLCIGSGTVFAGTINVPGDEPTIQAGIDAASNGDTVLVADGTYTGNGNKNIDFGGKAITVISENGPDNCIIDCKNYGRAFIFRSGEGEDSVVSGFTITNSGNSAICHCLSSSPTISNCKFLENIASEGGAIYTTQQSHPTIFNCTFTGNQGNKGGAIFFLNASTHPIVTNCTFSGNSAATYGGAIYNGYGSSRPTITNCTFSENTAGDDGGAVYNADGSAPIITNCIFWADSPDEIFSSNDSDPIVSFSNVEGGYSGTGNISADPLFVDQPIGDFHLTNISPCINAGTNDASTLPTTDKDGLPRIADGTVDMGAYEVQGTIPKGGGEGDGRGGGGGECGCFISTAAE